MQNTSFFLGSIGSLDADTCNPGNARRNQLDQCNRSCHLSSRNHSACCIKGEMPPFPVAFEFIPFLNTCVICRVYESIKSPKSALRRRDASRSARKSSSWMICIPTAMTVETTESLKQVCNFFSSFCRVLEATG